MQKKIILMSILAITTLFCGCAEKSSMTVEYNIVVDETGTTKEVTDESVNIQKTNYVLEDSETLNTDYHIKNEASEITHMEYLFSQLNNIS